MQQFVLKLTGLALVMGVLLFSACEDNPIITDPLGPDIQLIADPGFVDASDDVEVGSAFDMKVTIFTGDAKLQSVEIFEGADKLPTDRFTINAGAITTNNPFLVTGADKDGATYEFRVNAGSQVVGDVTTYTVEVTDESGEKDAVDVVISTVAPPGTPVDMTITGVLLNQAGPVGTGGLDLDTGTGTGSADGDAEIRDLGIDCTIAVEMENWRALFGTVNGADMRQVDLSVVENFTFDGAGTKEAIQAAYDSGITLADGESQAPSCATTTVTDATASTPAVDDMFVIFANNTYYLIRIDEVNFVHSAVDPDVRNDDNFVFSIKF